MSLSSKITFVNLPSETVQLIFEFLTTDELTPRGGGPVCKAWSALIGETSSFAMDLDALSVSRPRCLLFASRQRTKAEEYATRCRQIIRLARLNTNLTNLALKGFGSALSDEEVQPLLEKHSQTLIECSLAGSDIESPLLAAESLALLDLSKCGRLVKPLLRCPSLRELDLSKTHISDAELAAALPKLSVLRVLRLRGCKNVRELPLEAPSLQVLDLSLTNVSDAAVASLSASKSSASPTSAADGKESKSRAGSSRLAVLFLSECKSLRRPAIESDTLRVLSLKGCSGLQSATVNCPALTDLDISRTKLRDQAVSAILARAPLLAHLKCKECWDMKHPAVETELRSLTTVDAMRSGLEDAAVRMLLLQAPELRNLRMQQCYGASSLFAQELPLPASFRHARLDKLILRGTMLTDAVVGMLLGLAPALTTLDIDSCMQITGTSIGSESLTELDVSYCNIEESGFNFIVQSCPALRSARFDYSLLLAVDLAAAGPRGVLKQLQYLSLANSRQLKSLKLALPLLERLDLNACFSLMALDVDRCSRLREVHTRDVPRSIVYDLARNKSLSLGQGGSTGGGTVVRVRSSDDSKDGKDRKDSKELVVDREDRHALTREQKDERRRLKPEFAAAQELQQRVKWQFEESHEVWADYPAEVNADLEQVFQLCMSIKQEQRKKELEDKAKAKEGQQQQPSASDSPPAAGSSEDAAAAPKSVGPHLWNPKVRFHIDTMGQEYVVDVFALIQSNTQTHSKRRVRRNELDQHPSAAAAGSGGSGSPEKKGSAGLLAASGGTGAGAGAGVGAGSHAGASAPRSPGLGPAAAPALGSSFFTTGDKPKSTSPTRKSQSPTRKSLSPTRKGSSSPVRRPAAHAAAGASGGGSPLKRGLFVGTGHAAGAGAGSTAGAAAGGASAGASGTGSSDLLDVPPLSLSGASSPQSAGSAGSATSPAGSVSPQSAASASAAGSAASTSSAGASSSLRGSASEPSHLSLAGSAAGSASAAAAAVRVGAGATALLAMSAAPIVDEDNESVQLEIISLEGLVEELARKLEEQKATLSEAAKFALKKQLAIKKARILRLRRGGKA